MFNNETSRESEDHETSVVEIRIVSGLVSCLQTEVNTGSLGKSVRTG